MYGFAPKPPRLSKFLTQVIRSQTPCPVSARVQVIGKELKSEPEAQTSLPRRKEYDPNPGLPQIQGGPQIPFSFNLWASPNLWEKIQGSL